MVVKILATKKAMPQTKHVRVVLNQLLPVLGSLVGLEISTAGIAHAELMIFGGLIVWFLIVEPHGLARLWSIGKQKLRLWPFPH